jgi:hypothetical protein
MAEVVRRQMLDEKSRYRSHPFSGDSQRSVNAPNYRRRWARTRGSWTQHSLLIN